MKIEVLLSTYNGEKYLVQQLDSLLSQTYHDFHITIRDDGSTDQTTEILRTYTENNPERITFLEKGTNLGYPDCFWFLLNNTAPADMYAFCDQDDVWDPHKLESCWELCHDKYENSPILYVHDYKISDGKLNIYNEYHIPEHGFRPDNPYNLIYYQMISGFAIILNDILRQRILKDPLYGKKILHDQWTFWAAFFSGEIIYDRRMLVTYRRHENTVTITDKNPRLLFIEWWEKDIKGGRLRETRERVFYFISCYKAEMNTKFPGIADEWLKIVENNQGIGHYLTRLSYPRRLKPTFVGELILRICFLLRK